MDKLFVDTDVIIDFLTDREPHSYYSSQVFDLAEKNKVVVYVSSLSINNVYYVARKMLGDKKAREVISILTSLVSIWPVNGDDIITALESDFKDFEDAVQHACARRIQGVQLILTRNTKDYKKSKLAVFTPESFIKGLSQ
ncbi:MAG: PIN domain-containing protein [Bacteroidota bacterium]